MPIKATNWWNGREMILPDTLRSWIDANVRGLGQLERIRFIACRRIPFWWIPGNKRMCGLTLWSRVYVVTGDDDPLSLTDRDTIEIIFHELVHVTQFRKAPWWFPVEYFWNHL